MSLHSGVVCVCLFLCLCLSFCLSQSVSPSCPAGWATFNGSCFLVVHGEGVNFDVARNRCRSFGGDLLWVETEEELRWVTAVDRLELRKKWSECGSSCGSVPSAWIGLRRIRSQNPEFAWVNNDLPLQFSLSWYFGHPKPSPDDFVAITEALNSPSRFLTATSSSQKFTICRQEPEDAKIDWIEHGHSRYLLVKESNGRTFEEARADCKRKDVEADLLWLETQEETNWLMDRSARDWRIKEDWGSCSDCSGSEGAWIGLYRNSTESKFRWTVDGSEVTVNLNWWTSQQSKNFVFVYDASFRLFHRDAEGSVKLWHFCKMRKQVTTITAPPTTTSPPPSPCPSPDWILNGDFCILLVKGSRGLSFSDADSDCRSRGISARLLWVTSQDEMTWLTDRQARNWRIGEDFGNCTDCDQKSVRSAWIGASRLTSDGTFRWLYDNSTATKDLFDWWFGHPKPTPADYIVMYDSKFQLKFRTKTEEGKRWHFCKMMKYATTTASTATTLEQRPTTPTTSEKTSTSQDSNTSPTTTLPITTSPTSTSQPHTPCPSPSWIRLGDSCVLLVKQSRGRTFDAARSDCQSRHPSADLLWVSNEQEMQWLIDHSERKWGIRRDWLQCENCARSFGAWVGLRREAESGEWKWLKLNSQVQIPWLHSEPSLRGFAFLFDTGSKLWFRTNVNPARLWHFCRVKVENFGDVDSVGDSSQN